MAVFSLLEQHRLESYYNQFVQLGVKDERDFLDSVTDEDLNDLGKMDKWQHPSKVRLEFQFSDKHNNIIMQVWRDFEFIIPAAWSD